MKTLDQWLELYAVSHQNRMNKLIHNICVPVITFTVFGLFWTIPVPSSIQLHPFLNWSTLFGVLTLLFYIQLSFQTFLLMAAQVMVMLLLCFQVDAMTNLLYTSIALFVIAWIGQFWGHKIEGKKPSFFQDLQFLLIGPLWVLKGLTGLPKSK
jgi:uncharacterized membrane protein YGL010W